MISPPWEWLDSCTGAGIGAGKYALFIQREVDGYTVMRHKLGTDAFAPYKDQWHYADAQAAWRTYRRMERLYYGFGGFPQNVIVLSLIACACLVVVLMIVGTIMIWM